MNKVRNLRAGYRRITNTDYAINRKGQIYNFVTDREMTPYTNNSHWSGNIKLTLPNGDRVGFNVAELVSTTFGITREDTLRRSLVTTRD